MMKQLILVGAFLSALSVEAPAQTSSSVRPAQGAQGNQAAPAILGTVRLTRSVMADGKPLPAGSYQVRLTSDEVKVAVGQAPGAERWVEFLRDGKVVGRELATVIGAGEIGKIAKGRVPKADSSTVELLRGGDYWRVWINTGGNNYIINMPPAA
jgi:hypothetical protein